MGDEPILEASSIASKHLYPCFSLCMFLAKEIKEKKKK
jgi:hypothetical protein